MIDARTIPENTSITTDVCIVGAGAAGISLARECAGQPFRVCLLESGGLEYDQDTQELYKGDNVGLPYFPLEAARLRFFGGSTNHWTGFCLPYDDIDFEAHDWLPYSGWPFDKAHLDPYYERAQAICQLGPYTYDPAAWATKDMPLLPFVGDRVRTRISQISPPTRFGQVYRHDITRANNICVYLRANVVDIETDATAQTVTRLRVACLQGPTFWVVAKFFILATGGIENARLLLLSNKVQTVGLGNSNDLVGRFFMDHVGLRAGFVLPSQPYLATKLYTEHIHPVHKIPLKGSLALSPETIRREQLLNAITNLTPVWPDGVEELKRLKQDFHQRNIADFFQHLGKVIVDIDDVTRAAYGKIFKGNLPITLLRVGCHFGPVPNPDSRIALAPDRDSLGQNRVRLDWRLGAMEKRSLRRALELLGQELGRAGLGRLQITLDEDDTVWSPTPRGHYHHMGTTRMHLDPKQGVVDSHCRVHGIANLFIAGSSVFPTAGHANPTLTIVALAVRLAEHIKRLMA